MNKFSSRCKNIIIGCLKAQVCLLYYFYLFVNDLISISDFFKTILFADDTTLSFSHKNPSLQENFYNEELDKLHTWTLANRLTLNVDKTFFMKHSFCNSNSLDLNLKINDDPISCKPEAKFRQ